MRPSLASLTFLALAAAAPQDVDLPPDMKLVITEHFKHLFITPQSAIWKFEHTYPYVLGGTAVCGEVNYQDSLRRYVGMQRFYLVIRDGRAGAGDILPVNPKEDPTGTMLTTYQAVCEGR